MLKTGNHIIKKTARGFFSSLLGASPSWIETKEKARRKTATDLFLRKLVRSRRLELPRAKPTAPSTLRVYQFRHDRRDGIRRSYS